MHPQPLDVRDKMIGCIDRQVGIVLADQRAAPPAAALVKQHGPVCRRIEVASGVRRAAGARPPCSQTAGSPCGVPTVSQYKLWPSPTSSAPKSYGSTGSYKSTTR